MPRVATAIIVLKASIVVVIAHSAGNLEQLFDGTILVILAILVGRVEQDCQAILVILPHLPAGSFTFWRPRMQDCWQSCCPLPHLPY